MLVTVWVIERTQFFFFSDLLRASMLAREPSSVSKHRPMRSPVFGFHFRVPPSMAAPFNVCINAGYSWKSVCS